MVNEIGFASREKRDKGLVSGPPDPTADDTQLPSRHMRHALSVHPNFADAFYPREDVIDGLAAQPHEFRADNARHKITRQIENLLRRRAV